MAEWINQKGETVSMQYDPGGGMGLRMNKSMNA